MEVIQCLDDVPSWFSEIDLNLGEGLSRLLLHRATARSLVFIPTQFKLIHQSNFILTVSTGTYQNVLGVCIGFFWLHPKSNKFCTDPKADKVYRNFVARPIRHMSIYSTNVQECPRMSKNV
jgi:hypothetical protein